MDGLRARSVSEIVGTGLGPQRAALARAMRRRDPAAIARSSAELVARSDKCTEILYYASKLAGFVLKEFHSKQNRTYEQRERLVRREWARIKKKEKIRDERVITEIMVSAAVKAIARK